MRRRPSARRIEPASKHLRRRQSIYFPMARVDLGQYVADCRDCCSGIKASPAAPLDTDPKRGAVAAVQQDRTRRFGVGRAVFPPNNSVVHLTQSGSHNWVRRADKLLGTHREGCPCPSKAEVTDSNPVGCANRHVHSKKLARATFGSDPLVHREVIFKSTSGLYTRA